MPLFPEDLIKLLLAILLGGLVGAEREYHDKAAGFRTMILICTGATLFTIFSMRLAGDRDPTRIAAQIVSGVGFLGAGAIMRDGGRITGLTTASTIWLAAALGMGIGGGFYLLSGLATVITLSVLWLFPRFESRLTQARETRTYELVCAIPGPTIEHLANLFKQCGLRTINRRQSKANGNLHGVWEAYGSPKNHQKLIDILLADPEIKEFRF